MDEPKQSTPLLSDSAALRESEVIRLPTEVEWEKVAAWDDEKKAHRLWVWGNEWDATKCNAENKIGTTTPVGKYAPAGDSFYGAADMSGNVWEWCADWYDENYYQTAPERNPKGSDSGQLRIARGGSWYYSRDLARCASRSRHDPRSRASYLGFRVAESVPS